jgi:hypothetical protein
MRGIVMSDSIVDKTLIVIGASVVTELATGDFIYQVTFGYYTENTPEILSRIPTNMRETFSVGKNIAITEATLLIKADVVPYKVGSEWKLKIHKNGSLSLVEAK